MKHIYRLPYCRQRHAIIYNGRALYCFKYYSPMHKGTRWTLSCGVPGSLPGKLNEKFGEFSTLSFRTLRELRHYVEAYLCY